MGSRYGRRARRLVSVVLAAMLGTLGAVMGAGPAWADPKRDFNGDGRGDLLTLFDYGNGSTGLWVFPGVPNQPNGQPGQIGAYEAWETPPGNYWISATKNVAGDFNGDGRTDIISLYDYGNGAAGLFVIPGTGGSGPTATDAHRVWYAPPGNFWPSVVKVAAGDVNGDGSDDLVGLWDYANSVSILWVWPGDRSGPGTPYQIYYDANWEPNVGQRAQLTTLNWDHDGMDDIAVVANGKIRMFNGTDQRRTGYSTPYVLPLAVPTDSAALTRSVITSADVDGDGDGELVGMFDKGNGASSMWVLSGSPNQVFMWYLAQVWSTAPGDFPMNRTKVAR